MFSWPGVFNVIVPGKGFDPQIKGKCYVCYRCQLHSFYQFKCKKIQTAVWWGCCLLFMFHCLMSVWAQISEYVGWRKKEGSFPTVYLTIQNWRSAWFLSGTLNNLCWNSCSLTPRPEHLTAQGYSKSWVSSELFSSKHRKPFCIFMGVEWREVKAVEPQQDFYTEEKLSQTLTCRAISGPLSQWHLNEVQ